LITEAGNSSVAKRDIETWVKNHKNTTVFTTGFSAGGGDVQNLLWSLKALGIPVEFGGFLDSVELEVGVEENQRIPNNVKRAKAFYQKGTPRTLGKLFGGLANVNIQYEYKAEDSAATSITNEPIDPAPNSPADPTKDEFAYHRNMDNDEKGWGQILDYIRSRLLP
jgi:hypothetical protein